MNPEFRLYFLTQNSSKVGCDFYMKLNIVNFEMTEQVLQEQLLSVVVTLEQNELEIKRQRFTSESWNEMQSLQEVEETILRVLSSSEDTNKLMKDQSVIDNLLECKQKSK